MKAGQWQRDLIGNATARDRRDPAALESVSLENMSCGAERAPASQDLCLLNSDDALSTTANRLPHSLLKKSFHVYNMSD
jgi:hypothetical protein